jgi:hypothetical protein
MVLTSCLRQEHERWAAAAACCLPAPGPIRCCTLPVLWRMQAPFMRPVAAAGLLQAASQVHVLLPSISSSNHRDQQKPCSRTELYTASWTASHLCCRCSGHRVHHSPCPNGPNVRALASTGCTLRSHVKFPSISYEESLPCLDHDVMLPPSCCQCCGIGAAGLLLRHR